MGLIPIGDTSSKYFWTLLSGRGYSHRILAYHVSICESYSLTKINTKDVHMGHMILHSGTLFPVRPKELAAKILIELFNSIIPTLENETSGSPLEKTQRSSTVI